MHGTASKRPTNFPARKVEAAAWNPSSSVREQDFRYSGSAIAETIATESDDTMILGAACKVHANYQRILVTNQLIYALFFPFAPDPATFVKDGGILSRCHSPKMGGGQDALIRQCCERTERQGCNLRMRVAVLLPAGRLLVWDSGRS